MRVKRAAERTVQMIERALLLESALGDDEREDLLFCGGEVSGLDLDANAHL